MKPVSKTSLGINWALHLECTKPAEFPAASTVSERLGGTWHTTPIFLQNPAQKCAGYGQSLCLVRSCQTPQTEFRFGNYIGVSSVLPSANLHFLRSQGLWSKVFPHHLAEANLDSMSSSTAVSSGFNWRYPIFIEL